MRANRAGRILKSKIKSLGNLKKIVAKLHRAGAKVVFTNGCFDLLHYGHVKYLQDASRKGDVLVVAVNSDSSVRKIKGKGRPIVSEIDRLRLIAALESVDYAFLFNEPTPLEAIKQLKPDILVKGADWNKDNIVGSDLVLSYGARVQTIKLVQGRSTTNLIRELLKKYKKCRGLWSGFRHFSETSKKCQNILSLR